MDRTISKARLPKEAIDKIVRLKGGGFFPFSDEIIIHNNEDGVIDLSKEDGGYVMIPLFRSIEYYNDEDYVDVEFWEVARPYLQKRALEV